MPFGSRLRSVTPIGLRKRPELQANLAKALSKEKWNEPNSLLHEIALETVDDLEAEEIILREVWRALEEKAKMWRRVFKALSLTEFLLKRGSLSVIEKITHNSWRLQKWTDTQIMEDGRDVAGGIREKARLLLQLLSDIPRLNEERHKNYKLHQKMAGIGADQPRSATTPRRGSKDSDNAEGDLGFHPITESEMEAAAVDAEPGSSKPDFQELQKRCEQIQRTTGLPARQAMMILKNSNFDVGSALFLYGMESSNEQPRRTSDTVTTTVDSDSDSSESSSSSSSEPPAKKGSDRSLPTSSMPVGSAQSWPGLGPGPGSVYQGKGKEFGKGSKGKSCGKTNPGFGQFAPQQQQQGQQQRHQSLQGFAGKGYSDAGYASKGGFNQSKGFNSYPGGKGKQFAQSPHGSFTSQKGSPSRHDPWPAPAQGNPWGGFH